MGSTSSVEEHYIDHPSYHAPPESRVSVSRSKLLSGASDGQQRDFARFWEQYVPGGARTSEVSRPLMREVLLRAIREKSLLPTHRQWAEELVANAMSSAPSTLAVEKAFGIYQALMQNLQSAAPNADAQPTVSSVSGPARVANAPSESSYAKMPKGARMLDPAPLRAAVVPTAPGTRAGTAAPSGAAPRPEELFAPMKGTRAAQESTIATLRAQVLHAQQSYERLVASADACRNLVRGGTLEVQADMDQDKIQGQASLIQQQEVELSALRDGLALQQQRHAAALQRFRETQEKLEEAQNEAAELSRQAKTEELRSTMLREAFEQEQNRVGHSLIQAESSVNDLALATESTRRFEFEESAVQRECAQALNEVQTQAAREELAHEAKMAQLVRELESAKSAHAAAARPTLDVPRAAALLTELRRGAREHGLIARKRAADAQAHRKVLEAVRFRANQLNRDLVKKEGWAPTALTSRLRLEADEAALEVAELRLQTELTDAEAGNSYEDDYSYEELLQRGTDQARLLSSELESLREQLNSQRAIIANHSTPSSNLLAAGLQRRVGQSLAAQREAQQRIQEELLKGELMEKHLQERQRRALAEPRPDLAADVARVPASPGEALSVGAPPSSMWPTPPERGHETSSGLELRARLAALRGQLNPDAAAPPVDAPRASLHEQLQSLRTQLVSPAST
ncbi:unnamed protein product [Durusdinium trenchii]|uniref:Protein CASP n=1 Tax=Durusdinium trenchii TaxID=1381693 RepID=A0ABP0NCG2_9DINO